MRAVGGAPSIPGHLGEKSGVRALFHTSGACAAAIPSGDPGTQAPCCLLAVSCTCFPSETVVPQQASGAWSPPQLCLHLSLRLWGHTCPSASVMWSRGHMVRGRVASWSHLCGRVVWWWCGLVVTWWCGVWSRGHVVCGGVVTWSHGVVVWLWWCGGRRADSLNVFSPYRGSSSGLNTGGAFEGEIHHGGSSQPMEGCFSIFFLPSPL